MTGEPTLKCVIAWSDRRNLCSLVAEAVQADAGPDEVQRLGDDTLLVYSAEEPETIRDRLKAVLDETEAALVLEFERWSSLGRGVDTSWLLRRGH
jgi:hypothetical protein